MIKKILKVVFRKQLAQIAESDQKVLDFQRECMEWKLQNDITELRLEQAKRLTALGQEAAQVMHSIGDIKKLAHEINDEGLTLWVGQSYGASINLLNNIVEEARLSVPVLK